MVFFENVNLDRKLGLGVTAMAPIHMRTLQLKQAGSGVKVREIPHRASTAPPLGWHGTLARGGATGCRAAAERGGDGVVIREGARRPRRAASAAGRYRKRRCRSTIAPRKGTALATAGRAVTAPGPTRGALRDDQNSETKNADKKHSEQFFE